LNTEVGESFGGFNDQGALDVLSDMVDEKSGLIERTFMPGQTRNIGDYKVVSLFGRKGIAGKESSLHSYQTKL
jgi:hypothetical protein